MRNALAHVPKSHQSMVAAALRQAFLQPDQVAAPQTWRQVADQLRARWPKLAALMDESEHDVLAYMAFPAQHRTKSRAASGPCGHPGPELLGALERRWLGVRNAGRMIVDILFIR